MKSKYRRWHDEIISRAKKRNLSVGEKHHIKLKSFGGDDSKRNTVVLTYKEHFLVHWLLTKFVRRKDRRRKALYALHRMTNIGKANRIISGWQYEISRKAVSKAMSGRMVTIDTRKKISKAASLQEHSKDRNLKISIAHKSIVHHAEWNAAVSAAKKGKVTPKMLAAARKRRGKKCPAISLAKLGKKRPPITKKWRENLSAGGIRRWERWRLNRGASL